MTKRLNNVNIYKVVKGERVFGVQLEYLKNDYNGNPRYKATVYALDNFNGQNWFGYVYTFTGHYCGDLKEAEWIVDYHLKQLNKD